jgi:probable HAF family extracellular repeat protein
VAQEQERKARQFPHYTVTDLGTLGGSSSGAFGISRKGHVGGGASLPSEYQHPFLWTKRNGMRDLGTLGGPNALGSGPNDRDEVPILSETPNLDPLGENFCGFGTGHVCRAAVWENGRLRELSTLGGNNAQALAINAEGQIIGLAENNTPDAACPPPQVLHFEAAIWEPNGNVHELPPLPGDTVGFALRLNDKGQVVGSTGSCANTTYSGLVVGPHAVLWDHLAPINLGSLGGSLVRTAAAINDKGEVVGASDLASEVPGFPGVQVHSFLWTRERGMQDIGTVNGDFSGLPTQINNDGQVVGASCDSNGNCRAFVWQKGNMRDLNALIPADSPLYLVFAFDINDDGQIVGQAVETSTGDLHAFLATPSDQDDNNAAPNSDEGAEKTQPVLSETARQAIRDQLARCYGGSKTR